MAALSDSFRLRIPCAQGRSPARSALPDRLSNSAPAFYSTSDLRVEFALLAADALTVLTDISIAESVTVRIKASETSAAALLSKAVAAVDLEQSLVQADWVAGTDQHGVVEFTNTETNLLAADSAAVEFWLHIFYTTTDSPDKQVTVYSGPLTVYPPEIPLDTGALSGASIIPAGAVYSGAGAYSLSVIDGRRYSWTKGANDTNLVNGAETLTVTGNFTAAGVTVTLNGTPSAVITAAVRAISTFTPEESDARYLRGDDVRMVQNRYAVTALTGGGTALDGVVTGTTAAPTIPTGSLFCIELATVLSFYELVTGTDAESSPNVIRPDDYAASTNERVWKLRSVASTSATSHEAIAFSSAGNTDVTPAVNSAVHGVVATVTAGAGSFTRTVALLVANSSAGDLCIIRFDMPASANPLIQVRNATSGGTLLTTITGETGGVPLCCIYEFNGTAWIEHTAHYVE